MCIERNKNKLKKDIIYFRRCPDHWKGLLALRANRGYVNLEKSASRSFIKLLCFKKENAFFIFLPKQISQRLTFYAEMTLRALFHFTLTLLRCKWEPEQVYSPGTITYSTVQALMWTMQCGSEHISTYLYDLLQFCLSLWCQYHGLCGQLRKD